MNTSNKHVPPGFEKELENIAIDFDGVVHTFDKGWHDGTCYGEPIEGSLEAIKKIAEKYDIKGYPTIKLIYKGEVYDYDAKPEKANLIKFLETSIE